MTSCVTALGAAVVLLAGLAGLSGCSSAHDAAVRRTSTGFYASYAADDGAAACERLAPRTRSELEKSADAPCEEAVLQEQVPSVAEPTDVRVFGTQAEVMWRGETTFLARFQGGWRVTAAACTERENRPYDCTISGG